jgi:hypothetical protein
VNAFDLNESIGRPVQAEQGVDSGSRTRYNTLRTRLPVFANNVRLRSRQLLALRATTTPGVNKGTQVNSSIRVTWQASPRNKIAGTYKADKWCNCPNNISATVSPEAAATAAFPRLRQTRGGGPFARSTTTSFSRPWGCTCSSAGATGTTA